MVAVNEKLQNHARTAAENLGAFHPLLRGLCGSARHPISRRSIQQQLRVLGPLW